MSYNHWTDRFPYLVPVWNSLSNREQSSLSHQNKNIDPNLIIDFGGIGMYGDFFYRKNHRLPYKITKPPLPFFIDSPEGTCSKQSGRNCLCFSSNHDILISCHQNQIRGIHTVINQKRLDYNINSVDEYYPHQYNINERSQTSPFLFRSNNVWQFTEKKSEKNILEMKLFENENRHLEIITQSLSCLKIYEYLGKNDSSIDNTYLRLISNLKRSGKLFPEEDSILNYWDRSQYIPQEFLTSFVHDNRIYRWDIEKGKLLIEKCINTERKNNSDNLIGLLWAKELNPYLYFYGSHNEISMGDLRQNSPNQFSKPSLSIFKSSPFVYFNQVELLQTFAINPMESHQLIAASDFNINFFDIRFPNKNIFQCKHMLTPSLVKRLNCQLAQLEGSKKLLLVASNANQSCLFTFDLNACLQPIMEHYPFYPSSPRKTKSLFSIFNDSNVSCFTGTQILPGKYQIDSPDNDFFSFATMLNNGDIYMQDFYLNEFPTSNDQMQTLNDFKYENNFGDPEFFKTNFDDITKEYIYLICNFKNNSPNRTTQDHFESLDSHDNMTCDLSSESHDEDISSSQPRYDIKKELCLLDEDVEQMKETTAECNVLDQPIRWTDKDNIDFDSIKNIWNRGDPKLDLRNICNPVTISVCDRWFNTISSREEKENGKIFDNLLLSP